MSYKIYAEELLKKKGLNVCSHHDADGVYSLALAAQVLDIDNYLFPDVFGDYKTIPGGPGEDDVETDLAMDLGQPLDKEYTNYVIDHHPHPDEVNYKLAHMHVPTGLIVYNMFKDKIPKEKLWLVAGSLVGDGQAELIPREVFDSNRGLLDRTGSIYQSYGKFNMYDFPVYLMLSSGVNGLCRIGNPMMALKVVMNAKDPLDVLENPAVVDAKEVVKKETARIFKDYNKFIMVGSNVIVYPFSTQMRLTGLVASKLAGNKNDKTIIVVNQADKGMSMRGHLADYIGRQLQDKGWTTGGHSGYYGGNLEKHTTRELIYALREIL